jgi:predicted ArsR family transcriptional regulator
VEGVLRSFRISASKSVNFGAIVPKSSMEPGDELERRLHRALGDASRARMFAVLHEASAPLDARELAQRVGLHANTVRSHLRVLAEVGLVSAKAEERARPGRPRILYELVPETAAPGELGGYRLLAQILAGCLAGSEPDPAARAEQAGEAWGSYLVTRAAPFTSLSAKEAVDRVVRLLDELGFQPKLESDEEGHKVLMKHCPFSDVATAYEQVVCQVHLGLVRGALAELGGPVAADWLKPHVEPDLCIVHLAEEVNAPVA